MIYHFFRILFLGLYVLCFLSAFAAYYCATITYRTGDMTQTMLWAGGGVVLTVVAFMLYRVYKKLAGR